MVIWGNLDVMGFLIWYWTIVSIKSGAVLCCFP